MRWMRTRFRDTYVNIGETVALLAAATALSLFISSLGVGLESVIMVFLLGVLFTNVLTKGYLYGVAASLLSLILFDYCFVEPIHTFTIGSARNVTLIVAFEVTAIVSGWVASRLRLQTEISGRNERIAQMLYKISGGFLNVSGEKAILLTAISFVREYAQLECAIEIGGSYYPDEARAERSPARAYDIHGANRVLGTLFVYAEPGGVNAQNELIVKSVVAQIGIALDREYEYGEREDIRVEMERADIRGTLLRTVAHDLRAPLTAMTEASGKLSDEFDALADADKKKLALGISERMVELTILLENLLHMTRLDAAKPEMHKTRATAQDAAQTALARTARLLRRRDLRVTMPERPVSLQMDVNLVTQALVNLLGNAVMRTPPGGTIALALTGRRDLARFTVSDDGATPEGATDEPLYNYVSSGAEPQRGVSLGLAVCKAVAEAHGGEMRAQANDPKGMLVTFELPVDD